MDLGTMEQRIRDGYYTSMDMFQHDFMLVTQNAQIFNPPTSIYHTAARRLETWGLRAIEREGMSVVDDGQLAEFAQQQDAEASSSVSAARGARARRKRTAHERDVAAGRAIEAEPGSEHLSRRMMRIGSARSTTWSLQVTDTNDPAELRFRRTLAYAGVGQHQLTGKSACSAKAHAKAKPRFAPPLSALEAGSSHAAAADDDSSTSRFAFAYREDGSVDAGEVADVREFFAQRRLVAPLRESLRHLPMTLTTIGGTSTTPGEPGFVFPPAQAGRPDALAAATQSEPTPPSANWSHTFRGSQVPEAQQSLPYAVAMTPAPAGLGGAQSAAAAAPAARPVWSAPPLPPLHESGLRLNRRERELEQERDEQNWTFFRPHMQRLIAHEDVGLFANMPSWAAAVADDRPLQPYATVDGAKLTHSLRDYLRALPYRALSLPRTAQYVPRVSLQQLPLALQVSMQGAQESERLVDAVYGGVEGLAYAHSVASFVDGAADTSRDEGTDGGGAAASAGMLPTSLAAHARRELVELTGGLLDVVARVGDALAPLQVAPRQSALDALLDDADHDVARALWAAQSQPTGGPAPPLQDVLAHVLGA